MILCPPPSSPVPCTSPLRSLCTCSSAAGACIDCRRRRLCTCSSHAGAHRGRCRRILCTCSSAAGARRGCCRRSLCTCSSLAGARRCRCRRSLCTCSSAAGARRHCCRRSLCTCFSAAGARRSCCRRSLCTGSALAGARKGRCRSNLCTCSSAEGARTDQGPCGASWMQKDVAPELWPGLIHCLGLQHALRAGGALRVALLRAPPAFSSCPPQQPPGHPCGPTSYFAAYSPRGGFLCSQCGPSTPAWCSCPSSISLARPLRSDKMRKYFQARSVAERQHGHEAVRHRVN